MARHHHCLSTSQVMIFKWCLSYKPDIVSFTSDYHQLTYTMGGVYGAEVDPKFQVPKMLV